MWTVGSIPTPGTIYLGSLDPACRSLNPGTGQGAQKVHNRVTRRAYRRNVYLDKRTVTALKQHRKRQRQQRLAVGPAWDGTLDLVVCDEVGHPIDPAHLSRAFELIVARLDVPRIRLHDLRHTHAAAAYGEDV